MGTDPTNPANYIPTRLSTGSSFYNAVGGGGGSGPPYGATPKGYAQIALTNSAAVGLGTIPSGATFAYIIVEGADARFRDDGANPTTAAGMPVYAGQEYLFAGDLSVAKFISQQAAGSTLNVSFYA